MVVVNAILWEWRVLNTFLQIPNVFWQVLWMRPEEADTPLEKNMFNNIQIVREMSLL